MIYAERGGGRGVCDEGSVNPSGPLSNPNSFPTNLVCNVTTEYQGIRRLKSRDPPPTLGATGCQNPNGRRSNNPADTNCLSLNMTTDIIARAEVTRTRLILNRYFCPRIKR